VAKALIDWMIFVRRLKPTASDGKRMEAEINIWEILFQF
jgi:hypothetical protein